MIDKIIVIYNEKIGGQDFHPDIIALNGLCKEMFEKQDIS